MRLVSCYIRAFGTLKDKEFDFDNGLNQILCDNGVGKTTLISFIRAMLYGLDYKQNSSKFYERVHFFPWDGNECGGSLVIEENGKKYRIERSFDKKASGDTFRLFDEDKKSECNDFGEDIGERILGVDKVSFEKSLYLGQEGLDTAITPSLNAKMGNLSNVRDDMNRFDEAIKSIDRVRQEYEKKSSNNPGKIKVLKEQIKECEACAEQIPVLESAAKERKRSIDEKKGRIDELVEIKEQLALKIKKAGEDIEKAGAIKAKREQLEKLTEEIEKEEAFFAGKTPLSEELEQMNEKQREYVEKSSRLDEINGRMPSADRAEFLKDIFGAKTPITGETIELSQMEASEIARLRAAKDKNSGLEEGEKTLEALNEFFANKLPTTEEITGYRQLTEKIKETEAELKVLNTKLIDEENALSEMKTRAGGLYVVMIFAGLLMIIAGMLIGILVSSELVSIIGFLTGLIVGSIITVVSVIFLYQERVARNRDRKRAEGGRRETIERIVENKRISEEAREQCLRFLNLFSETDENEDLLESLIEIQRKLDEHGRLLSIFNAEKQDTARNADALAELTLKLYTRLAGVGEKYGIDLYNDHRETELLSALSDDIKEYDEYLGNTESAKLLSDEIDILDKELSAFTERYVWEDNKTREQKLMALKGMLETYSGTKNRIEELKEELSNEGDENPDENSVSLEELQQQMREADEQYEPLVADRTREEEELSRVINDIDDMEERARALPALKEKMEELSYRVSVLSDTKKYLEQARDDFLSVYMKPLRDGMSSYIGRFLSPKDEDDFEITLDMDLSVKIMHRGGIVSGEYLSEGYKDMAALCARLALIDVLYKGEKPPLMMDDPFSNLDDKKIQKALAILQEISTDTQIVYFTCHESRVLKNCKSHSL